MNILLICFLFLMAPCYSCRVKRETAETVRVDRQAKGRLETNTSWMEFGSRDSSFRYWYFRGDSGFFFHPDKGLWGQSGKIAYIERKSSETAEVNITKAYDSLGIVNSKLQSDTRTRWTGYSRIVWLWVLLIPIGIGGWMYWRWRK